ncbi:MAG: response regulator [Lachnospiraceae bacterium]|nr:response regulator [Lachnospiraceae bacterium]
MKYKLLLTGKNEAAIDDFFMQMSENFEMVTSSTRFNDISNHISFFRPDVFVYCMNNETRDDLSQIANLKFRLSSSKIPLVIFGLKEDCDEYIRIATSAPDLVLHRPITVSSIESKIIAFVKDSRFQQAVDEKREERVIEEPAASSRPSSERRVSSDIDRNSIEQLMAQLASPDGGSGPIPKIPGARRHILVVDDNAMMLKMLKEHLHDQYDVATAASGRVALKFLEKKTTDLILLDYEMPEESGPDVLEKLRASELTKDIPVIFLTGVTDTKKVKEVLSLKPQSYLLKPVDRDKLLDTIAKVID